MLISRTSGLKRIGLRLADLVFPPRCAACGEWGGVNGRPLCLECAESVARQRLTLACPVCAAGVAPYEASWDGCGECRATRKRVAGTERVGPYGGVIGDLLRAYKYRGREDLEPLLCEWLADRVAGANWIDRVEAVVAVPTHWRHAIRRRFHAAEVLAGAVARTLDLPKLPLLRRVRAGPHQVGLTLEERKQNVRNAFSLRAGVRMRRARVLLIDDVRTTGATINECARMLRRGGAHEVYAGVVATAYGPLIPRDETPHF